MKVTWQPAPGNVLNYRVTYKPVDGGRQLAAKVPGTVTDTVLRRLHHMTTYNITVHPVYRRGEGKARQGLGTTRTLVSIINPVCVGIVLECCVRWGWSVGGGVVGVAGVSVFSYIKWLWVVLYIKSVQGRRKRIGTFLQEAETSMLSSPLNH